METQMQEQLYQVLLDIEQITSEHNHKPWTFNKLATIKLLIEELINDGE